MELSLKETQMKGTFVGIICIVFGNAVVLISIRFTT